MRPDRRHFLGCLAAGLSLSLVPRELRALVAVPRQLSFRHVHTGERLAVEYFDGLRYLPDALQAVDHLLRDFRTGDVLAIEPTLLDLLHLLHRSTGATRPYEVISGYRSPETNAMLRRRSHGVAAASLHMRGMAIDLRVEGVPLRGLRKAALQLRRGGVGYYPSSNFVHVDVGPVRSW